MFISDMMYDEVFVFGTKINSREVKQISKLLDDSQSIIIAGTRDSMAEDLELVSISDAGNKVLLHGILTPSKIIPEEMGQGDVFVMIVENNIYNPAGLILEPDIFPDEKALAEIISEILSTNEKLSIDNIYTIYGYSIEPRLTIDNSEVDTIMLEACMEVAQEVSKMDDVLREEEKRKKDEVNDDSD